MLIGELADATGTTPKTLRFYEREGLLPEPDRLANGYRSYDADAVARVRFVRRAQAAGFTLAQIGEILTIRDDGREPCSHVEQLISQRLDQIEERLVELRATRATLRALAQRSDRLEPAECTGYCHIIEDAPSED